MSASDPIAAFRELHQDGCFLLPNPWNRGSARMLQSLGFSALATTSAGLAFDLGRPDSPTSLGLDPTLDNIRDIVEATPLPVNADFQAGYAESLEQLSENVTRCVGTGVAGLSIEDARAGDDPLYSIEEAVERIRAARAAIDASGRSVVLTGRAECFLVGHTDPLRASIERLVAYSEAGADCLYAPGLATDDEVRAVVEAVAPKPVNVLVRDPARMSLGSLRQLGVRRISVGSALVRVAWGSALRAAREMLERGTFASLSEAEPFGTFNEMFDDTPSA